MKKTIEEKEKFIQDHTQEGNLDELKGLAEFIVQSDDWGEVEQGTVETEVVMKEDNINLLWAHPYFNFDESKDLGLYQQGPGWGDSIFIEDESNEEELYDAILGLAYDYVKYALEHYTDEAVLKEVLDERGWEEDEYGEMSLYEDNWEIYDFEAMMNYGDKIAEILGGVKDLKMNYFNRQLELSWTPLTEQD